MSSPPAEASLPAHCDALVIGGGLAGVTCALLLKRRNPDARIVLVEARRKAATTAQSEPLPPLASQFFSRSLHIDDLLAREHLPNYGRHDWFALEPQDRLAAMSVIACGESGSERSFHVDSSKLASSIGELAGAEGVQLVPGAEVLELKLGWPENRVRLLCARGERGLTTRWVVDTTGASALISNDLDLLQDLGTPGTWVAAANWSGVLRFDGPEMAAHDGLQGVRSGERSSREFATHHFRGPDWNVRLCPHVGGGASVSLTQNRKVRAQGPQGRTPLESYSRQVRSLPGLRELLATARLEAESFRAETRLDLTLRRHCGRGWFLVGGAAGPLTTPFASPLDTMARDAWVAGELVTGDLAGSLSEDQLSAGIRAHNEAVRVRDTADAMELFGPGTLLHGDAALHAVVCALERGLRSRRMRRGLTNLAQLAQDSRRVMWTNSVRGALLARLRELAQRRRQRGLYGNCNRGWHCTIPGSGVWAPLLAAARLWVRVEYSGLRSVLSPVSNDDHTVATGEIAQRAAQAREASRRGHLG